MTAITQSHPILITRRPSATRLALLAWRDRFIETVLPRRCMLVSAGMFLAGISVPTLMVLGLMPASLLLGLLGISLTALGGMMALVLCGEI